LADRTCAAESRRKIGTKKLPENQSTDYKEIPQTIIAGFVSASTYSTNPGIFETRIL